MVWGRARPGRAGRRAGRQAGPARQGVLTLVVTTVSPPAVVVLANDLVVGACPLVNVVPESGVAL